MTKHYNFCSVKVTVGRSVLKAGLVCLHYMLVYVLLLLLLIPCCCPHQVSDGPASAGVRMASPANRSASLLNSR